MSRIPRTLCLAALALAAGCVGPSREELLDPMVGQDVAVAIEALGQPDETVDLGEGRHLYVWRRIYGYDVGRRSTRLFDPRRDDWLFDDEPEVVEARICSTRMEVGFDFRIGGWDYVCETVYVERGPWDARPSLPAAGDRRRSF